MFITYLPQRGCNDDIKSTHMQPANYFEYSRLHSVYLDTPNICSSATGIKARLHTSFISVCGLREKARGA